MNASMEGYLGTGKGAPAAGPSLDLPDAEY